MTRNFVQMLLLVYTKSQEESLGRGLLFLAQNKNQEFVVLHKTTANCAQSQHVHFFHSF